MELLRKPTITIPKNYTDLIDREAMDATVERFKDTHIGVVLHKTDWYEFRIGRYQRDGRTSCCDEKVSENDYGVDEECPCCKKVLSWDIPEKTYTNELNKVREPFIADAKAKFEVEKQAAKEAYEKEIADYNDNIENIITEAVKNLEFREDCLDAAILKIVENFEDMSLSSSTPSERGNYVYNSQSLDGISNKFSASYSLNYPADGNISGDVRFEVTKDSVSVRLYVSQYIGRRYIRVSEDDYDYDDEYRSLASKKFEIEGDYSKLVDLIANKPEEVQERAERNQYNKAYNDVKKALKAKEPNALYLYDNFIKKYPDNRIDLLDFYGCNRAVENGDNYDLYKVNTKYTTIERTGGLQLKSQFLLSIPKEYVDDKHIEKLNRNGYFNSKADRLDYSKETDEVFVPYIEGSNISIENVDLDEGIVYMTLYPNEDFVATLSDCQSLVDELVYDGAREEDAEEEVADLTSVISEDGISINMDIKGVIDCDYDVELDVWNTIHIAMNDFSKMEVKCLTELIEKALKECDLEGSKEFLKEYNKEKKNNIKKLD